MKKYITHYGIAITLFFTSIASAMKRPLCTSQTSEPAIQYKNIKNSSLLEATRANDLDMIARLFRDGTDANLKFEEDPVFFYAKTPEAAKLFADNGANLNASSTDLTPNVLAYCVFAGRYYNPTLIQFYIDKGVDPRILNKRKRSLLHLMADMMHTEENENINKTVIILLNTIGDMINTLDGYGYTPLDLKIQRIVPNPNIIALFKKYGAKTSEELKQIGVELQ